MPNIKGSHVNFCNTVVKSPQQSQNFHFFWLKWLIYVENFSPFSFYTSNNLVHILLQLETFHAHLQSTRTKKTFCWCYTKYTRKLLSVSLNASVKRRSEPLNDRCFDFTYEFKHSELSHFTLQTSIQHKKSKTRKASNFL